MIDLHTHTTASDGSVTPAELMALAEACSLTAVAITDHDTLAGVEAFLAVGRSSPVRAIAGVEIACSWYGGSVHLVGLFIDHRDPVLTALLERVRGHRGQRNEQVFERLATLGVAVDAADVEREARGESIGRPHVARALVARGYCATTEEAFARFLGRGQAAYVPRYLPLPVEGIETIHGAGGVAVWAHPLGGPCPGPRSRLRQTARQLSKMGLDGIEVHYSDHTPDQEALAGEIAREYSLLPSGGSDFHGDLMPGVALGKGYGKLCVPDGLLPPLEARAKKMVAAQGFEPRTRGL